MWFDPRRGDGVSRGFSYRGELSETGLPEVFGIIERYGVPGVLEVTREGMVKRVFTQEGYVVHANSSDPIDRLSEHIRRTGLVDENLIDALDQERSNSSKRLGVLLVERGLLSPRGVYEAICGQIEEIVWSLFAWQSGEVVFSTGEIEGEDTIHIKLPMRRVAFEGIKRAPEGQSMASRLGEDDGLLEPCYKYEDLIDIGIDSAEMELLRTVDGRRSLEEIYRSSPFSESETARRLHAFLVLSLLRVGAPTPSSSADVSIRS